MIAAIVNLIIYLLVLGCLFAVADYAITNLLPDPPARILRVIVIVLLGLVAILLLFNLLGAGGGLDLPKIAN